MVTLTVRRLEAADDRTAFTSGNVELDRFFQRYAGQTQFRHHIGTTYIAVDEAGGIHGYATVAVSEVSPASLSLSQRKRLPKYALPVLRLARLAFAEASQGQGVGGLLFGFVLSLAEQLAQSVGCVGVVVDAKADAVSFYERLGFAALDVDAGGLEDRPVPTPMFLALS